MLYKQVQGQESTSRHLGWPAIRMLSQLSLISIAEATESLSCLIGTFGEKTTKNQKYSKKSSCLQVPEHAHQEPKQ